jgi:hypothetical protein
MNGGEGGDSPWLEGSMRGGDLFAPRGSGEDRQSSSESRGDAIGDTRSPKREGRLGLGFFSGEWEGGLSLTRLGWFDLTRSGGSDQWAQV